MNEVRNHLKGVVDAGLKPAFTSRVMDKVVRAQTRSTSLAWHPSLTLLATLVICVALMELTARGGPPKVRVLDAPWVDLIAVAHEWRLHL